MEKLYAWYANHKRDLPWRHTKDPYLIWLSEVILQQTRVVQGLPYYLRFAEAFPTVQDLAHAEEREVLRLWQGLGYYSRAKNLHQTAKIVVVEHGGIFPDSYAKLLILKGIGPYTAAAIASFAYNEAVAVLDGNVYRVLSRLFGMDTDIASHQARKIFGDVAQKLMAQAPDPSLHNQAMMEFGALQCVPASPQCMFCPLQAVCVANAQGRQAQLPVKNKKIKVRERFFQYVVLEYEGNFYLQERTDKDVWQGLYDFYLVETSSNTTSIDTLTTDTWVASCLPEATLIGVSEPHTHILTHQRIHAQFWHFRLNIPITTTHFYTPEEIEKLPKPRLIERYWEGLKNNL